MRYPLCNRTVTIYRYDQGNVQRYVVSGCFYRWQICQEEKNEGIRQDTKSLLVIPGEAFMPQVGDRVFDGIGPEAVNWEAFLPALVSGLSELNYVTPQYWQGKICHTESGRR